MEAIAAPAIGDQRLTAGDLEHLPDRPVLALGTRREPSMGEEAVLQPGVELGMALQPQPGRAEALAPQAPLVLDVPLLPARYLPPRSCSIVCRCCPDASCRPGKMTRQGIRPFLTHPAIMLF